MNTAYSCLVDGGAKFEWQAVNLCTSLIHSAGILPDDIKIHVTPSVSEDFRKCINNFGASIIEVEPFFAANGYCNKIQQMMSPAFKGYDRVVLCDCDLFFVRPIDLNNISAAAAGRIVDRPNPPYELLRKLFSRYNLQTKQAMQVGFANSADEITETSNWNGGLYVFDAKFVKQWGEEWAFHAKLLMDYSEEFAPYENHIDQIAWALTLASLQIPFEHISEEHNYPIHFKENKRYELAPKEICSFHYHHCMDIFGFMEKTGVAVVDQQIIEANQKISDIVTRRIIQDDYLLRLFQNWQNHKCPLPEDGISRAEKAFHAPRYIRHNARRLEHLATLQLDIYNKSVLEFGAGVDDHSQFFLDRGCHVTSLEPRPENVAYILHRHNISEPPFSQDRHRVIRCGVDHCLPFLVDTRFQIVYNYDLLNHLSNPADFIRQSARYCEGIYLLETAVSDLTSSSHRFNELSTDLTNSIDGNCCLLSRKEIFDLLKECLPYAYIPTTQPNHEQFLRDWSKPPAEPSSRHRAIFVGSRYPLTSPFLTDKFILQHAG